MDTHVERNTISSIANPSSENVSYRTVMLIISVHNSVNDPKQVRSMGGQRKVRSPNLHTFYMLVTQIGHWVSIRK